jgi:hypothetical protein
MRTRSLNAIRTGVAMAAVAGVLGAPLVGAQTLLESPRSRQGYYLAVGVLGSLDYNREHGDSLGVWRGAGFSLRMGQLLTRRFGLGLTFDYAASSKGSQTADLGGLGFEAQWELAQNLAVHAQVGLGFAILNDPSDKDMPQRGTVSSGYLLGLSYDWFPSHTRRSGGFALTPVVQARLVPGDPTTALIGLAGVELAWWTGLPSNQLELPESDAYRR